MEENEVQGKTGTSVANVSELRRQVRSMNGNTQIGFGEKESFELMYRVATAISRSELVPDIFRDEITIKSGNNKGTLVKNPSGIPNSMLALNIATRLDMDVLMVMNNMMVIDGRLSWSSQFVIAAVNRSKNFTAIRFEVRRDSAATEFEYVEKEWNENSRKLEYKKKKVSLVNSTCVAWAIEKETGERVESPEVSLEMAISEGWYGKKGSKWKTMPDVMLRYRAASFFGKLYASDMLMGMPSEDELLDMDPEESQKTIVAGKQQVSGVENNNLNDPEKGENPGDEEKSNGGQQRKAPNGNTHQGNEASAQGRGGKNHLDLRGKRGATEQNSPPEHDIGMEHGMDESMFSGEPTDEELLADY